MIRAYSLAAFCLAAACGGSGATPFLATQDSNFNASNLVGQPFGGAGFLTSPPTTTSANATITIQDTSMTELVLDGATSNLQGLGGTVFEGVDDVNVALATRLAGGPITRDVLYMLTEDKEPVTDLPRFGYFVDGNRTLPGVLATGTAEYTGVATGRLPTGETATGTISLDVDFAFDSFDADLTGVNPNNTAAIYTVRSGTESAGTLTGALTGTSVVAGVLNGGIYGEEKDQAAGTFLISIPGRSVIGVFGATD